MSKGSRQTWLSIIIAAVIILGMLGLTVVGGTAMFVYRHVNSEFTGYKGAEEEFSSARARFAGQEPLIEVRQREEPTIHREQIPPASTPGHHLVSLRVIAYDEHAGKIVRVSIPFWLLRLLPSRHLSFLNDQGIDVDIDSDRVSLTLDDLDRRGPGLVLDQRDRRGSRVLVWTE